MTGKLYEDRILCDRVRNIKKDIVHEATALLYLRLYSILKHATHNTLNSTKQSIMKIEGKGAVS